MRYLVFSLVVAALCGCQTKNAVQATLDRYTEAGRISGVVSVLSDADYNEQVDISGYANIEKKTPLKMDTMFAIFSMTKTTTGIAMMCAIDDGVISLDDKVSKYLPEFADIRFENGAKPKRELTMRDLLSHTDGLRNEVSLVDNSLTLRDAARWIAKNAKFKYEPGETFEYGTMRFSAAAAAIEVATHEKYEHYLKRKVFEPLEMADTTWRPTPEQVSRLVTAYTSNDKLPLRHAADKLSKQLIFPKKGRIEPAPGGGLFSTPRDMVNFSQMLAHHGEWKGQTIVSRKTFDEVFCQIQVAGELGVKNPYTVGAWVYGDWIGHEGAMRTDQRANLKTGQSRVFFLQTENKAGPAFFQLKRDWHDAADAIQGTARVEFGH